MLKHLRYTFPLQPRETRSCSTLVCVLLLDKFLWVKNVVDKSKMWLRGCARLFLRSYQRRFLESMKNSFHSFQLFHQHHTIDMESRMSIVSLWWKSCKLWKVCGPVLRPDCRWDVNNATSWDKRNIWFYYVDWGYRPCYNVIQRGAKWKVSAVLGWTLP